MYEYTTADPTRLLIAERQQSLLAEATAHRLITGARSSRSRRRLRLRIWSTSPGRHSAAAAIS